MSLSWSDLREAVHQAIAWIVTYTRVAKSSADGNNDEVEGRSEPDEPSYQIPVRRMWPFGIRSRPPTGVEAVVILVNGGATRAVMVGAESAKYGPSDLADGESALYNATAALVRLWKSGKLTIESDRDDVVVNQGTLPVARKTDPTVDGTLEMKVVDAPGPPPVSTVTFLYTPPGGAPQNVGTLTFTSGLLTAKVAGTGAIAGKIDGGADHFKA